MATEKAPRTPTVVQTVTMDDGRVVEFAGKRRMLKSTQVENGEVTVRLDFVNGETRVHKIRPELLLKFAAHGAEQKLGDEVAGIEDVEDSIEAIDVLLMRLEKGEWNVARAKSEGGAGIAGASILVRALVELTGKTVAQIRESLADKTQEEKMALRRNAKLRPIIERLEVEKQARKEKKTGVDSDALLDGMLSSAPPTNALGTSSADETETAEQA